MILAEACAAAARMQGMKRRWTRARGGQTAAIAGAATAAVPVALKTGQEGALERRMAHRVVPRGSAQPNCESAAKFCG